MVTRHRSISVGVLLSALAVQALGQDFETADDVVFAHENPSSSMLMGGGMAWFDLDADGDDDLFLVDSGGGHSLLRNDDGAFTETIDTSGISTTRPDAMGVAAADYDDDGFVDLYITYIGPNELLRNRGDGTFEDVTLAMGLGDPGWGMSASWADFDRDGDLDLYLGNYIDVIAFPYHIGGKNCLFINEGTSAAPVFVDRAAELGVDNRGVLGEVPGFPNPLLGQPTAGCTLSVCTLDYDDDGDADLAIGNDFGAFVVPNALFRNDTPTGGALTFTDVSEATGFARAQYNMGINPADFDRDGDWDFYLSDLGPNLLLRNDGGVLTDVTETAGPVEGNDENGLLKVTSWSTVWADVDNDGWEDLYVINGHIPAAPFIVNEVSSRNALWLNNGDGTLAEVEGSGTENHDFGRGGAAADFDGDGLVDILVVNNGDGQVASISPPSPLYRNRGTLAQPNAGWVQIRLRGVLGHNEAVGARIDALADGALLRRQVLADPVFLSSKSRMQHFGLGAAEAIDTLQIRWPSGTTQQLHDIARNQRLTIEEPLVTVADMLPATLTRTGIDVGVRLVNGDTTSHAATARFTLRRGDKVLLAESVNVRVKPGTTTGTTVTWPLTPAQVSRVSTIEGLEVRVDVTANEGAGLDTRVVPVNT